MMLKLSQRDPRWAHTKIGKTNLTIGDWGCALTCVSMLSSYFGCYMSPDKLAQVPGLFTANGEIIWSMLEKVFAGKLKFVWRQYGRDDQKIRASIGGSINTACLLQVNNKRHWVVATGIKGVGYQCLDPIDGKSKLVLANYPNITGSCHLVGTL